MLIDSHCHVLKGEYENPETIIADTFASGVNKIIINGYDLQSSMEAVSFAKKYENVYAAVGIGPENIDGFNEGICEKIADLAKEKKVVAIGEIGLDYHWTKETKDMQIFVLKKMLEIASKNNLPVIVHCRKAFLDTYNLLKEYNINGILHCYSGSIEMAKEFIKLGFLLGIGGVVTFKNAKELKEVVKKIDVCNFSLETDSPYLSPEPFRGRLNMPKNVIKVAEEISRIKGISLEEVKAATSKAVCAKFDL